MIRFISKLGESSVRWLVIGLILTGFGLLALYSIASHAGEISLSSRFAKHALWIIPSLLIFVVCFSPSTRIIHKYAYVAFGLGLGALLIPFLTGTVAGTHRWISLGSVSFQPSEPIKWFLVIALARYLSDYNLEMKKIYSLAFPIIIALIPAAVILRQSDLGSAIIVLTPVIPMLFWVGAKPVHLFLLLAPILSIMTASNYYSFTLWIIILAVILYRSRPTLRVGLSNFFGNIFLGLLTPYFWGQLKPYHQERILVFFDVSRDPKGAAYQVIQSQTAIGSGGFWGKGWGKGTQTHLKFLPEQETDFIFSVIGEEFGFVIVCLILGLFAFLVLDLIHSAYKTVERFPSLVLIGIATLFLAHIFVNVGMTVNLLPVKGLPLPFLSYGGTFLLSCYAMLGLAMNMSVEFNE
ncbi:MAG: FtsW/RodA/SpoVE family cell cycle protein [Candidatus Marinimicrobia bacterium]|jgi:rod shape determining protein RodA|nr:FtsW/RodA/SpoVE family cell cycle protein [Candidatus Neomarinimicrobiota bacterium]MDP6593778.1 FtsW/RodA/SpoVE family cell cycle protein [Candidatus Neomarinimicrobiota bacterium]MDP6835656.1 FtsW/RodA/SpoVE family cell cycle protein [Candidatus Neomarinimicrobiota bacterium]MDP6966517.1 FtsW/RodA/SpoVE family cell cycle protein [Candidatus Neomarinimicrobiota bacterium]